MPLFRRRFASVVFAGSLLLLSACGGGDDADDAASEVDPTTSDTSPVEDTTTAEQTTTTEQTTTVEETTTTAEESTTTVAETTTTTTAAPPATLSGPSGGALFTDAGGRYSLIIEPSWTDGSEFFPDGIQGWFTGNETVSFAENVNIVTSSVATSTPLDLVVTASIETLEGTFTGFTLIESGVVAGVNHPELGILEYSAVQDDNAIRFLQTFGVWNDTLVVFTGSTDAEGGEAALEALLDYALTLAPPAGS